MEYIIYIPQFISVDKPVYKSVVHSSKCRSAAKFARSLVRRTIIKGILPFPSALKCADCGEKAYCYDHRDYSKPLEVVAVCRRCNAKRGAAL